MPRRSAVARRMRKVEVDGLRGHAGVDPGAIAESGRPEAAELIRKILLASASIPALFPPVMFNVQVNGVQHQELRVDGGASMQTFLYPARLRTPKTRTAGVPRRRIAYIIRNGRFSEEG